jgi:hypothetical protein
MPRRQALTRSGLPFRLEQTLLGQPDQQRIERAGSKSDRAGQIVAVSPFERPFEQSGQ